MPDPITQQDEQTAARKKTAPAPEPSPAPSPDTTVVDTARYEPYPGAAFFHGGRHSPLFAAMARRLDAEGCTDGRHLGPDWTTAHRDAFATWQRTLRPKEGGDVSGIPDQVAWDRLHVPRITPLPKET
ncbi:peptidoglycan-binding protein [Streptomyces sp. NBRC 110035]|uniref:peptidoglycan-binding protein n=1 Tax=Streptomyces sp. NBRC 110035 TaxID=1547867 RepID=UPI000698EC0C|nr:peptidoglycan-binding protein [Streptomyces sp. NBRC 110035]